jgi:hypothetical protein
MDAATFCCVHCRLLQPPTTACVDCGAPSAPFELVRELLQYRDMKVLENPRLGVLTAFLAGGSFAVPLLAPAVVASAILLAVSKLRAARRRHTIAGVAMPPPHVAPGAVVLHGVPRRFHATISTLIDNADARPVVAAHAVVRDRDGAILLRRSEVVPFLLDVDRCFDPRGLVLVTGCARMMGSTRVTAHRVPLRRGDVWLRRLGVPPDLVVAGELELATIVADGPSIAITGLVETEAVAELAFHRDGGATRVMRGRSGAPLLVDDLRLLAAAL